LDHLLHAIEKELAIATFMETDQKEVGRPKCIRNEAQTVTPAVQPQKAKPNTTKSIKNRGARHVDLWHDVSQTFSSPRNLLK